MQFSKISILVLLYISSMGSSVPSKLHCPLTWVPYTTGDRLPDAAFLSPDGTQGFGRGFVTSSSIYGIFSQKTLLLHIKLLLGSGTLREFEILTNPLHCTLDWQDNYESSDRNLRVTDSQGTSLGRSSGSQFAILGTFGDYYFDNNELELVPGYDFNYLISYTGLSLTLKNFVYAKSPATGRPSTVGLDEIFNNADTTVTQTITHAKSISNTILISVYTTNTWELAWNVNANVGIPGLLGTSAKHTETYSESTTYRETLEITRTQTISSSRTITVYPHTSVRICSIVGIAENFQSDYIALAEYRVTNWNGVEVRDYLISEDADFYDLEVFGDAAYRHIRGSFTGSISLNTKVIAVPPNSHYGCERVVL